MDRSCATSPKSSKSAFKDRTSEPRREGGRQKTVSLSKHLRRVTWKFSPSISISRYVSEKDTIRLLACVSHLQKSLVARYNLEPEKITITSSAKVNVALPHKTRFMNICGKIQHIDPHKGVATDSVSPYLQTVENGFGSFLGLFDIDCNLLVCNTGLTTLFRGASSTAGVQKVVQRSLNPNNITTMTLNMLVAAAHLGRPVSAKNDSMAQALLNAKQWSCSVTAVADDMCSYTCAFKITNMLPEWLTTFGITDVDMIQKIVVNINFNGSVFFFVTVLPSTPFKLGMECQMKPALDAIYQLILSYT